MAIDDMDQLIGKRLLVGISYVDADDALIEEVQFAGIVIEVDPLVTIDIGEDEPFTLPPEPDAFDPGTLGEYRLRATGEIVVDPDFTTRWRVTSPADDE